MKTYTNKFASETTVKNQHYFYTLSRFLGNSCWIDILLTMESDSGHVSEFIQFLHEEKSIRIFWLEYWMSDVHAKRFLTNLCSANLNTVRIVNSLLQTSQLSNQQVGFQRTVDTKCDYNKESSIHSTSFKTITINKIFSVLLSNTLLCHLSWSDGISLLKKYEDVKGRRRECSFDIHITLVLNFSVREEQSKILVSVVW